MGCFLVVDEPASGPPRDGPRQARGPPCPSRTASPSPVVEYIIARIIHPKAGDVCFEVGDRICSQAMDGIEFVFILGGRPTQRKIEDGLGGFGPVGCQSKFSLLSLTCWGDTVCGIVVRGEE